MTTEQQRYTHENTKQKQQRTTHTMSNSDSSSSSHNNKKGIPGSTGRTRWMQRVITVTNTTTNTQITTCSKLPRNPVW